MRQINRVIVHCSATPPNRIIGAEEIREWHVNERGFDDIGYHYVIRRDGRIDKGRDLDTPGAHAKGFNEDSVGICLVGGVDENGRSFSNFTRAQMDALVLLSKGLQHRYGQDVEFLGHRDLPDVAKDCPCFDVSEFLIP